VNGVFNVIEFLRSISEYRTSLMYYPSAGTNGGHLLDYDEFNMFVYSDYFPWRFGGTRSEFYRHFLSSCGGKKIDLIAATEECRVFYTSGGKWGVFLFLSNDNAVDIIRKSEIPIEGFCGVVDGCVEGGNTECCNEFPFMSKILGLMGARMTVISDHAPALLSLSRGEAWMPALWKDLKFPRNLEHQGREFRITVESKTAPGFNNAHIFCVERTDGVEGYMRRMRKDRKTPFSLR